MIFIHHELDAGLEADLRRFIAATPGGRLEHDPRWLRVLAAGLGHETMALVAREGPPGSPICGYLPLALVRSALFGRFLVSLPYVNAAGVVASDESARVRLLAEAVALAQRTDAQYLELRHVEPVAHERLTHRRDDKVLMVRELPGDAESLWKALDAKVRNAVRKGDRSDLTIRWGGPELLPAFYDVFSVNMRDLGTPVYGRRLFERVLDHLPEAAELAVVSHGGRPVAAALLLHDAERASTAVPSASSLRAFNGTNANMWMYCRLLERAVARGSRWFDFGRSSPGSGTFAFKKQWGARPLATVWQYHVRRGDVGAMRPENPKMQRRIAAWQRLPVWVTRAVGPAIVRGIP